jgi:NAD(P)-dependent dehydrogenase (short-subunit alcohol dehydrogenase family)
LVTGAGRGIGKALAKRLAAEGARVTLVARSAEQLDAAVEEIHSSGGEALAAVADVADAQAVQRAVQAATARFGTVSVLVNNAGIPGPYGPIDQIDPQEWWAAQAVNVLGAVHLMHATVPGMRGRGSGRIINIASNAGLQPIPHLSAYAVSKSTLIRLTETVDLELRADGIRAFAVNPGNITTAMARGTIASPDAQRWVPEGVAMLRDRRPDESDADLQRCCDVVAALAAGSYAPLGGRYLNIWWDLDTMARGA